VFPDSERKRASERVSGDNGGITYLRYNVLLQPDWCAEHLGEALSAKRLERLEPMDEPGNIEELDRIWRLAGRKLIRTSTSRAVFDSPAA
jgi:hypothetical protein